MCVDCVLASGEGEYVCLWGVCIHFCICSMCSLLIVCGEGCVGVWPLLPLLVSPRRVGAFCECVWVSVCDAPSVPNSGMKGAGLPLFSRGGGAAQEHVGRITKEPSSPPPTCDLVICLLPPTVGSLGSQMPSLCSPPTTE